MIDKITSSIVEIKYLGELVDTFSKATHFVVLLGIVYLLGGVIVPLQFIQNTIAENYSIIMILLYVYCAYSLLNDVKKKQRFGVLIITALSFKVLMKEFTSFNLIVFVMWVKLIMETFKYIIKFKIKVFEKMPPVVDEQVTEYLHYLILLTLSFSLAFLISSYASVILLTLQNLLVATMNLLPVYLLFILLMQMLWSKGNHGDQTVGRIIDVLLIIMIWTNFENMVLNKDSFYTVNASFHLVFALGTGSGMTGMLLLALKIFKKQDVKEIAQGTMFSINEPVIWGLPIAMNKKYRTPFIIAPLLSIVFAWTMTYIGFAKALVYPVFWGTPPLLKSYLASGGDLKTVRVEFLSYVIVFVVYAVFMLMDKKKGEVSY